MAIHTQTDFDPSEYNLLGAFYIGNSGRIMDEYAFEHFYFEGRLAELGLGIDILEAPGVGKCESCGTRYLHGMIFERNEEIVLVGQVCGEKYFAAATASDIAKRAEARVRRARMFASDIPGFEEALEVEHYIIEDIGYQLRRKGQLSLPQIELVFKIAKEHTARLEAKAAQDELLTDVPEGRVEIIGTVLSDRWDETVYGSVHKMLVLAEVGSKRFKVWGSVPAAIDGYDMRGSRVSFTAAVTPSDDFGFGFYKRPTKASNVS